MKATKKKKGTRGKRFLSAVRQLVYAKRRNARPRRLRRLSEKVEKLMSNLTARVNKERK